MSLVKQLLVAIASVHEAGLMHRDIKPANILIREDGGILLCDFGQARVDMNKLQIEEAQDFINTRKLTLEVGSRWYKAPEILFGSKNYGQEVDLWALGCVIAELAIATIPKDKLVKNENPKSDEIQVSYRPLFMSVSDID